jgi:hypothetical protein
VYAHRENPKCAIGMVNRSDGVCMVTQFVPPGIRKGDGRVGGRQRECGKENGNAIQGVLPSLGDKTITERSPDMRSKLAILAVALVFSMTLLSYAKNITNETTEISGNTTNPLVPEDVYYEGTVHQTQSVTDNGNTYHVAFHLNFAGITGYGLTTGAKYQATGIQKIEMNVAKGYEQTMIMTVRLIGQGAVPNFSTKLLYHYTINANGEVTSYFERYSD